MRIQTYAIFMYNLPPLGPTILKHDPSLRGARKLITGVPSLTILCSPICGLHEKGNNGRSEY
jgi:hypothetical protein